MVRLLPLPLIPIQSINCPLTSPPSALTANPAPNGCTQTASASIPATTCPLSTSASTALRRLCGEDGSASPRERRLWRPRVRWRIKRGGFIADGSSAVASALFAFCSRCWYLYVSRYTWHRLYLLYDGRVLLAPPGLGRMDGSEVQELRSEFNGVCALVAHYRGRIGSADLFGIKHEEL
jgi:hypothetical protein